VALKKETMIHNISDLIKRFIEAEVDILNQQDIKHPPTIGAMFEGLTQKVLERSIFKELELNIAKNCFIAGSDTEFDIMLVEGKGEQIPHTERYKYKPEQVIVVIQVKKNLYSKDLKEGYDNLRFLIDYYEDLKLEKYKLRLFRDSFRAICNKEITAINNDTLTLHEKAIFDTLKIEALMPVRIILGYNGFKSELNFRNKFIEFLTKNITTDLSKKIGGFGPQNFPNLIISEKYSMMKNAGMPFVGKISEDGWWPFYTTSSYNPSYFLLETIWSRLSYKYQLPTDIFGTDLTMEPATKFLDCRIKEINGQLGWEYDYFEAKSKTLKENTEIQEWSPVILDEIQNVIITQLCKKTEIDLQSDKDLEKFVLTGNYTSLEDFIKTLNQTGLTYVENNKLRLLTDECQCAIVNGKYVAGENKSGRFSNWVLKEIEKNKKSKNKNQ